MTTPIRVKAHALVMWRRFRPWPIPWKCRNWSLIGSGVPYRRWKYYQVEIVGEGWTHAERHPLDVEHMALDYMACKEDKKPEDFTIESIEWINHY